MKIVLFLCLLYFNGSNLFPDSIEKSDDPPILYIFADKLPKFNFEGGLNNFVYENLKWPLDGQLDVVGTVLISFVITKEGKVDDIKIEKGLGSLCDEEVIRVFQSMPLWEPGEKDSKTVDVKMYFPVRFIIKGKFNG
jgi:TonB family protein